MSPTFPGKIIWLQNETYPVTGIPRGWPIGIDTGVTTDFSLISYGTCNFDVDWGDGSTETVDNVGPTTTFTTTHNYSTPGTYTVEITINSGDFFPYYNNSPIADELITLGDTPEGWSFGADLTRAFQGSANLTTVGDIDTSTVTKFASTWDGCTSLESFSLIDTSSGTNFQETWRNCTSLASFPLIDTSIGTNFLRTWHSCTSLASFPELSTSSWTTFLETWRNCSSLASFPALPIGKRPVATTNFLRCWYGCSSLTDFPANFFDSWTGTPANNCFFQTWYLCSSLSATSVENILDSIADSGQNAPNSGREITIDYDDNGGLGPFPYGGSAPGGVLDPVPLSITTLQGRSPAWTITLNGVAQ